MRSLLLRFLIATLGIAPLAQSEGSADAGAPEAWHAWLETPGGPLGFGLELVNKSGAWHAYLINGSERIPIEDVLWTEGELRIAIAHYDSVIEAVREGEGLRGTWRKRRGKDKLAEVPFRARRGRALPPQPMIAVLPKNIGGRWAVDFSSDERPAVGVFEQAPGSNRVQGTFLTSTGDYRYLSGFMSGAELSLSCFDGAHAFLFKAALTSDGVLSGDFYSGDWWHETWTARRDEEAPLVDAFRETSWVERASLAEIAYPDTTGRLRNLGEFRGRAYLLQVFGSWCPNCHDEARYLVELHRRYKDRGLSIVALAYELTGDFERDARQVETFKRRHGVTYPVLVAGTADKEQATRALGVLDRIRSYPTTVFLSGDGRVRAIHSGFAGPATGAEHARLRREFEERIEMLLEEEPASHEQLTARLSASPWSVSFDAQRESELVFAERNGSLFAQRGEQDPEPAYLLGDAVYFGEYIFRFDVEASALLDATDFGRRGVPSGMPRTPLFGSRATDPDFLASSLLSDDTLVVREAIVAAAESAPERLSESWTELAAHESLEVRLGAVWAAGMLGLVEQQALLADNLSHPNALLRRQTVRALLALDTEQARTWLLPMAADPDPLIRALLR